MTACLPLPSNDTAHVQYRRAEFRVSRSISRCAYDYRALERRRSLTAARLVANMLREHQSNQRARRI